MIRDSRWFLWRPAREILEDIHEVFRQRRDEFQAAAVPWVMKDEPRRVEKRTCQPLDRLDIARDATMDATVRTVACGNDVITRERRQQYCLLQGTECKLVWRRSSVKASARACAPEEMKTRCRWVVDLEPLRSTMCRTSQEGVC